MRFFPILFHVFEGNDRLAPLQQNLAAALVVNRTNLYSFFLCPRGNLVIAVHGAWKWLKGFAVQCNVIKFMMLLYYNSLLCSVTREACPPPPLPKNTYMQQDAQEHQNKVTSTDGFP